MDVADGTITLIPTTRNPFCAGHAQRGDGSILIVGGDQPGSVTATGTAITDSLLAQRIYHPCQIGDDACVDGSYEMLADMQTKRWYPSVVTIASGEAIIVSGSLQNLNFDKLDNTNNPTYEYYPARNALPPKVLPSLDRMFPFNLYPAVYQLAHGPVMIFTANTTDLLDAASDSLLPATIPDVLLTDKMPWIYPYTPTSVMLPLTKENGYTSSIMVCGGTRKTDLKADERCIGIDFASKSPEWRELTSDPMPTGRLMPDAAILPDGTILFVNGAGGGMAGGDGGDSRNAWNPVFVVHLYSPKAAVGNKWSTMASATVPRLYHSGAILLADGRVVTTGSEEQNYVDMHRSPLPPRADCFPINRNNVCTDPFEYRMEIYSPPYLSLAVERPHISSAPTFVTYNSQFGISTSTDARLIDKAVLLRYSTSTHSTNFDQRYIEANIVGVNATYLLIDGPLNGSIAPPGNYHLFLIRGGKPSIAATIMIKEGELLDSEAPLNAQAPAAESDSASASLDITWISAAFLSVLLGLLIL